jgi:hypothetical protein
MKSKKKSEWKWKNMTASEGKCETVNEVTNSEQSERKWKKVKENERKWKKVTEVQSLIEAKTVRPVFDQRWVWGTHKTYTKHWQQLVKEVSPGAQKWMKVTKVNNSERKWTTVKGSDKLWKKWQQVNISERKWKMWK